MSTGSIVMWIAIFAGIVPVLGSMRLRRPPRSRLSPSVTAIDGRESNAWFSPRPARGAGRVIAAIAIVIALIVALIVLG